MRHRAKNDDALDELLRHPALWRARKSDRDAVAHQDAFAQGAVAEETVTTISTGFAELDQCLPGGGWPMGSLIEILHDICGIGELSLLLPALSRMVQGE